MSGRSSVVIRSLSLFLPIKDDREDHIISSSSSLSPAGALAECGRTLTRAMSPALATSPTTSPLPHTARRRIPTLWTKWLRSMPRTIHSLWSFLYPASIASSSSSSYCIHHVYNIYMQGCRSGIRSKLATADLLNVVLPS
jgi:hypothetical protein